MRYWQMLAAKIPCTAGKLRPMMRSVHDPKEERQ
jgi:hypothetical protein